MRMSDWSSVVCSSALTVNALQRLATISAPMHPLGGLDDHLHVVTDADVQFLVFDARYAERALQLAQRAPNLRLLSFGPQPGADDLCARAENFAPRSLVAPKIGPPAEIGNASGRERWCQYG